MKKRFLSLGLMLVLLLGALPMGALAAEGVAVQPRDWTRYSSNDSYLRMTQAQQAFYQRLQTEAQAYINSSELDAEYSEKHETYSMRAVQYADLGLDADTAQNVAYRFVHSNPQYWFLLPKVIYTDSWIKVDMYDLGKTGGERAEITNKLFARIDAWGDEIAAGQTVYQKVKAAHDKLCAEVINVTESDYSYSIYAALIQKQGTSRGYAGAMTVLLNYAGVETVTVSGASHGWNTVKMDDGNWYAVDVHWDDWLSSDEFFLVNEKSLKARDAEQTHEPLAYSTGWLPTLAADNYPVPDTENFDVDADGRLLKYNGPGGTVTIPSYVKTISVGAFLYCHDLKEIVIPEGVTRIGEAAFRDCTGLTSVTIPASMLEVEGNAFRGCTQLTDVFVLGNATAFAGMSVFYECPSVTLHGLSGSVTEHFASLNGFAFAPLTGAFADVPYNAWYADYVEEAAQANLMTGTGNNQFSPDKTLSLSEVVTLTARLHTERNGGAVPVVEGPWYMGSYYYCVSNNILSQDSYPIDSLSNPATRFQMVEIMDRAISDSEKTVAKPEATVPDLVESAAYGQAVYKWYRAGILTGDQNGNFNGANPISRAETAAILCRLAGLTPRT